MENNWRSILWREWARCGDNDYAERLYKATYSGPLSWFSRLWYRRQRRPYAHELEAALHAACAQQGAARFIWQPHLTRLEEAKEKNTAIDRLIAGLSDHHWLERFISRHLLFYRGGSAVSALERFLETEPDTALWLLQSIAVDTKIRLAGKADQLMCPDCLIYCSWHKLVLPEHLDLTYYGCRLCHRSYALRARGEDIAIILDNRKFAKWRIEDGEWLGINWIKQRELFDFGWVEIMRATDEEVERFAVQVGNDTDPYRRPRYAEMLCLIDRQCKLSRNTMRILQKTFGTIEIVE